MNEKISNLIQHYINFLEENPANEYEAYKWQTIAHFQQHWDINAPDFYEMFKEAFSKKDNLVYKISFHFLDSLGKFYPQQLKELFLIVYSSEDFYIKLEKAKNFAESKIDDLKNKLYKETFKHQFDERLLSFLLTMQNPDENTFYQKNIYIKLCEYLGISAQKDKKYYHFIELLTHITTFFNNYPLLTVTKSFIPHNLNFPLLLAQDIVYQNVNNDSENPKLYWLYSPGEQASKWEEFYKEGIIALKWDKLGNLENYDDRTTVVEALINNYGGTNDQRNNTSAINDFIYKMNIGDIIIAKKGTTILLGYGKITSNYYFDEERAEYQHCRKIEWIKKGVWNAHNTLRTKTLTDITNDESKIINGVKYAQYLLNIMNQNTENHEIEKVIALLHYKPQIILQGPPGTGKTREAKRIAKALLGLGENDTLNNNEQFKLIQFHPSYSYEDFVRGIVAEPNEEGDGIVYTAENKILGTFAKEALDNWYKAHQTNKIPLKNYVLIIDEINRANLSAVLGELIYALEYRGEAVQSMYSIEGDSFLTLPPNLYIIGTMNTADRSVGHIDYAIRRRFAFVNILPKDLTNELGDQFEGTLFAKVTNLFNTNLSPEFKKEEVQLGHSYFITKNTPINIRWEYEIKPILLEYVKDGILVGEGIETTINNLINNENTAS